MPTSARQKESEALEGQLPQSSRSMTDEVGRRNDRRSDETGGMEARDKEKERLEFEKMMEKERSGGEGDSWRRR